jgi:carboxymethylenebutenolidase
LEDGFVEYVSRGRHAEAYCSNPKGGRSLGQVIVIHEVWGFTRFIKDTCDRLSRQGFTAVAPVLYWRDKGLFSPERLRQGMKAVWDLSLEERYEDAKIQAAIKKGKVSRETEAMLRVLYDKRFRGRLREDLSSLARHLQKESPALRIGAIGYSMGGKLALQLAATFPRLAASVAYSAEPTFGLTFQKTNSPILLLYGGGDAFMLRDVPAFLKETIDRGKQLELKIYRGAGHEFFDHTSERDYNPIAANDAWASTIDFLRKNLSPPS